MGIATTTKSEQIAIRFPHAVLAATAENHAEEGDEQLSPLPGGGSASP